MATVVIPTRNDTGNYTQKVTLDGSVFALTFQFNGRENDWTFHIDREDGVRIRSGLRVTPNFPITYNLVVDGRFLGEIMFLDSRTDSQPPTFEEMGEDVVMTYTEGFDA